MQWLNPACWSRETREFVVMAITVVATVLTNVISTQNAPTSTKGGA